MAQVACDKPKLLPCLVILTCHVCGHFLGHYSACGTLRPSSQKKNKNKNNNKALQWPSILHCEDSEGPHTLSKDTTHVTAEDLRWWKMRLSWGKQMATTGAGNLWGTWGTSSSSYQDGGPVLLNVLATQGQRSEREPAPANENWPQATLTFQILFTYKMGLIPILEHCVENKR